MANHANDRITLQHEGNPLSITLQTFLNEIVAALNAQMTNLTISGTVMISALPTSDPAVAGQLWNSTGTLKVSAGP